MSEGQGTIPLVQVRGTAEAETALLVIPASGISVDELERAAISFALEQMRGNRTRAARFLSLSRSALLYRMRKHRIVVPHLR